MAEDNSPMLSQGINGREPALGGDRRIETGGIPVPEEFREGIREWIALSDFRVEGNTNRPVICIDPKSKNCGRIGILDGEGVIVWD